MKKQTFTWLTRTLGLLLLLPLTACQSSRVETATPVTPPKPYMRVTREASGAASLDIVIREFHAPKKRGPVVYLVGVSHIGDAAYYEAIQNRLEATELVLFEGVRASEARAKPGSRDAAAPPAPKMPKRAEGEFSLQADLAKSLGLAFQLEVIDYERPHFLNSDMTITQIMEVLNPPPPPGAKVVPGRAAEDSGGAQFESLMSAMDGSGFLGGVIQMGVKFIGSSVKLQTLVKLSFIEMLGSLEGDLSRMEMPSPGLKDLLKVLIEKRNHVVMEDLRAALAEPQPPKSIAIFYGAAHMPDMETRLQTELGYRPVQDEWLKAFSADPVKAGVTPAEVQMIKSVVDWQMKMLKPQGEKKE